jgi:ribosome-binding factor A
MLLNENKTQLRQLLARSVGNIFRVMPNLDFYEDDTPKTAQRLEELFAKLQPAPLDNPPEIGEDNSN